MATMTDGRQFQIERSDAESLLGETIPNTQDIRRVVAYLIEAQDGVPAHAEIEVLPIIGWNVFGWNVVPIDVEDIECFNSIGALLLSSGKVMVPNDVLFDSITDFEHWAFERLQKKQLEHSKPKPKA